MRLAVESLNYPERLGSVSQSEAGSGDQSGDGDSGRWSVTSSTGGGGGGGYYPGKFTERMERLEAASPSPSSVSSLSQSEAGTRSVSQSEAVSSPSCPGWSGRSSPTHAHLAREETFTIIPVERAGARERRQLWRMQLGSWTLR